MEFVVVLEPDMEGKNYVAFCPTLPGCFSQGDTREEALANIKEAWGRKPRSPFPKHQALKRQQTPFPTPIVLLFKASFKGFS